jgi:uncharacterized protein (TIGR02246 family)
MADDPGAVESLISKLFVAANASDVKGFVAVFAEDAEFTNVFGQLAKGRKAIEDFHVPLFSEPRRPGFPSFVNARFEVLESRIRFLRPDVAAVDVKWRQTGAIAPDGQPWGTRIGMMTWVVTRENGIWAIAVSHNTDLPPARA